MAAVTKVIGTYRITFPSSVGATLTWGPLRAWIHLFEAGTLKPVAELRFYDLAQLSSYPNRTDAYGMPVVSMCLTELDAIIDMLRNEKPISTMWDPDRRCFTLSTDREGIGELEPAP